MKKILLVALLLLFVASSAFAVFDPYANPMENTSVYVGVLGASFGVDGLKDAIISDVRWYPDNLGVLYLPLEEFNGSGFGFGLELGARMGLADNIDIIADLGVTFGKNMFLDVSVGGIYNFVDTGAMTFGAGAKLGIHDVAADLGYAQIWPGTTPPVITPNGTIRNNDPINFHVMNLAVTPIIDFTMAVTEELSVGARAGYALGMTLSSSLSGGDDVSLDPETSGVYYSPSTGDAMTMNPTAHAGLTTTVYVQYNLRSFYK